MDFSRVGAGIRWAADRGADVISLTGGTIFPVKPAPVIVEDIDAALADAWARGVVTVATAGNNGPLPWCQYPASSPGVICAAATDRRGLPAAYSQLPVLLGTGIAVRAPGGSRLGPACDATENVISTTLRGGALAGCEGEPYATDSGTTYATSHTAGLAALLAGLGLSNTEIVDCLRRTSTGRGRWNPIMGYGIIDATAAVAGCARQSRPGA
jgi:subtilisin family serine protease